MTGRSADEARQTWNKQPRQEVGSRYDFVWIPYYGSGGGYNTKAVTVETRSVTGGQVPAMIVDGAGCGWTRSG